MNGIPCAWKPCKEKAMKYQIFISSTYEDLKDERRKVRDAILEAMHFPVGMELFGAADETAWKVIERTIDDSDYYVLILGNRYGSETNEGISYTQKEYMYARSKGIPVLAFQIDENAPTIVTLPRMSATVAASMRTVTT